MDALVLVGLILMSIGGITLHEFSDVDGGVGAFTCGFVIFAAGLVFASMWAYMEYM
jgi:hypothetical protein